MELRQSGGRSSDDSSNQEPQPESDACSLLQTCLDFQPSQSNRQELTAAFGDEDPGFDPRDDPEGSEIHLRRRRPGYPLEAES